jgi:hypothetical protein
MVLTDRDVISAAETDEEILTFDVSDDALEPVRYTVSKTLGPKSETVRRGK